jgi:hypothetical protein
MAQHSHRFTIADDDAVRVLLAKLVKGGAKQGRRDKLLRALDDAARHYKDSNQKVRQAFFHGLPTGYAVALTLRQQRHLSDDGLDLGRAQSIPTV